MSGSSSNEWVHDLHRFSFASLLSAKSRVDSGKSFPKSTAFIFGKRNTFPAAGMSRVPFTDIKLYIPFIPGDEVYFFGVSSVVFAENSDWFSNVTCYLSFDFFLPRALLDICTRLLLVPFFPVLLLWRTIPLPCLQIFLQGRGSAP